MKKISELSEDTLIVLGEDIPVITVDEIDNYKDIIKNKKLKCYLAERRCRSIDNDDIEDVVDHLTENLQCNDNLLDDEYLEATEEEKEELYKIFNNMLNRTTSIYEYGEEIDINAYY